MASAVQDLFPGTKVTIGPVIEEGFYYDFDAPHAFAEADLEKIEAKMAEIIKADQPFSRKELTREEAKSLFQEKGENYKVEIIDALPEDETISVYEHGDWVDLCKGPHVESTGQIASFKLLSVAGAYWRGDENREQLQRIYGTAFLNETDLQEFLERRRQAEERDHRKLGRELDLFSSLDELGGGLILWHPRGARVRHEIENYWRDAHLKGGYDIVYTPHIAHRELWQTSGHLEFYAEHMFSPMTMENVDYQLKPMNCPFHIMIYKKTRRSYRDLPFRWAELGTVYRYERSGVIHGLMRVRGFTQDDAHIFCRADQLDDEISRVLDFTLNVLSDFGFKDYVICLSTKPDKYVGSDEHWEMATNSLESALKGSGLDYEIDPGEGVFYGPKIDIKIRDVLGRSWQCSTIQIDFNLPEQFGVSYIGSDGESHQAIMVHRALLGSLERFFGVLIEHHGGNFPMWLAPEQVRLLTISEKHAKYGVDCLEELKKQGFRVELDQSPDKLGAKIRRAELMKVPYMAIIGNKEVETGELSVRSKKKGDLGSMQIDHFIEKLSREVAARS
jgi:threonyl-tRNA synthetase